MADSQTSAGNVEKAALFILIVAAITWLGGVTIRWVLSGRLLVPGTLEFKPDLVPVVEREAFRMINYTSILTLIGYVVVLLSGTVFLFSTQLKLRENGWLMMAVLLFYMFTPVEIYTSYLDGKMISMELWRTPEPSLFRELFSKRVAALKGLPFIALLCYYTIIGLAIWQPLKKPKGFQPTY
jgi:hypothetical protein